MQRLPEGCQCSCMQRWWASGLRCLRGGGGVPKPQLLPAGGSRRHQAQGQEAVNGAAWVDLMAGPMLRPPFDHAGVCTTLNVVCFPVAGSLERVIDLHQRGHLTNNGKPSALEDLERSDAAMALDARMSKLGVVDQDDKDVEGGAAPAPASHRLTAKNWQGGVRCRDVIFSYRWVG